jgi:hypothetical protein
MMVLAVASVVLAVFMVWAAVSMSSTGQAVRAVEQGLTRSSAAGGGAVQGEPGRVPVMVARATSNIAWAAT